MLSGILALVSFDLIYSYYNWSLYQKKAYYKQLIFPTSFNEIQANLYHINTIVHI